MINSFEILETVQMIEKQNLDIRTITMGISLLDCASHDIDITCRKIYDKIAKYAENLVRVGEDISIEYGIPIINKRISITPISIVAANATQSEYVKLAKTLDKVSKSVGVNFLGGFSALVHKGYTEGDMNLIRSIPEALNVTERVCSSVNIATTKTGINMDAVGQIGDIIKETAELTADRDGIGCAKLVVFANAPEDNPFMAGAFHGVGEPECTINVGISGPGTVKTALELVKGKSFDVVAETIKQVAFKITRMGQLVASEAAERLNVPVT